MRWRPRSRHPTPPVYRVTSVPRGHSADLDARIKRYLVSMGIRTLCFVLAFSVHHPVRWLFAAGAIVLPYVAVVFANAGRERSDPPPEGVVGPAGHPAAIEPSRVVTGDVVPIPPPRAEHR